MRRAFRLALIFVAVGGVLSVLTGAVVFQTTSKSDFCKKCHIMDPYYESWQRGRHAKVECTACHMPPGLKGKVLTKFQALSQLTKYITRTWGTRPWGHVTDASCLECHDLGKLEREGQHAFGRGLKFSHGPHLAEQVRHKKLLCTTCHKQVERSVHMQIATQACNTCHFKPEPSGKLSKLASCTLCHVAGEVHKSGGFAIAQSPVVAKASSPTADCTSCHRKVVDGEGDAQPYRCRQCHDDQKVMKLFDKPDELHRIHVTKAGAECFNCHTEINHRRPVRPVAPAALDCQQCHGSAHEAQIKLFTGHLAPGGQPSGMHRAGLQCSSCHVSGSEKGKPRLELKPSACGECHSPSLNARSLLWMDGVTALIAGLKTELTRLRTPASGPAGFKLADELALELDTLTEARAIHNLPHARMVLEKVRGALTAALPAKDGAAVAPLPHQRWEPNRCVDCHFASLASTGSTKGRPFSHEAHRPALASARCDTCHDDGLRTPHGTLKEASTCTSCHHRAPTATAPKAPKAPECGSCHSAEKRLFSGKLPELALEVAPIWSDKSCRDCHGRQAGKADAPQLWQSCATCHDAGYDTALKAKLSGYEERKKKVMMQAVPSPGVDPERARLLRKLLESDRSGGAHHPALIEKVLDTLEGK